MTVSIAPACGRFQALELRTIDLAGAASFYGRVLGAHVEGSGDDARLVRDDGTFSFLTVLPDAARLRGAPPHWLGHLGVDDVAGASEAFVRAGAERLGPARAVGGAEVVGLRDPGGAPFAVRARIDATRAAPAAWHELHTTHLDQVFAFYSDLLGWGRTGSIDLGPRLGVYQRFAFAAGEDDAGGMVASAGKGGTSPHWEFYFATADLERSLAEVRSLGGNVHQGPHRVPSGDFIAACHDAQGAAFGLMQPSA